MRAHTMQSLANWRYSSVLDMLPSSSHTGGSATGLSVTNAPGKPVGDTQVCVSLTTIANLLIAIPGRPLCRLWRADRAHATPEILPIWHNPTSTLTHH